MASQDHIRIGCACAAAGNVGGAARHALLSYHSSARPSSFQARDNISQFIGWCRSTLAVPDTLLFETEDLVTRRNERNVLLCLLEVGSVDCSFRKRSSQLVWTRRQSVECKPSPLNLSTVVTGASAASKSAR